MRTKELRTVKDVVNHFYDYCEYRGELGELRTNTLQTMWYRTELLNKLCGKFVAKRSLDPRKREWRDVLSLQVAAVFKTSDLGVATKHQLKGLLNRALQFAGYPPVRMGLPRTTKVAKYLGWEQVQKVLAESERRDPRMPVREICRCGLRADEALHVSRVSVTRRDGLFWLHVDQESSTTKTHQRDVPFLDKELARRIDERDEPDGFTRGALYAHIKRVGDALKFHVHPHMLRHSWATLLGMYRGPQGTIPTWAISYFMGHTPGMTGHYIHEALQYGPDVALASMGKYHTTVREVQAQLLQQGE
jgi:integrase